MNSREGFKGFVSFLLLGGIVGLSYLGFKYLPESTSNVSQASDKAFEPISLKVAKVTDTSAEINWSTTENSLSIVFYSEDKSCFETNLENSDCNFKAESKSSRNHKITIEKLNPSTTYFYKVKSENYIYPDGDAFSFSTQKSTTKTQTDNESDGISSPTIDNSAGQILEGTSIKADIEEPQEPK